MEIKIYQGASEIGGSITGISCGEKRILVDFGRPLTGAGRRDKVCITDPYDAIIFTHYHRDHTDLMTYAAENIPMYIGKTAKALFLAAQNHRDPEGELARRIEALKEYEDGKPFDVGSLRITPILTDHSAFDSYMLLIEGDGKRVLHTGDFRLHGIKGDLVPPSLAPLENTVDVMITEGTNLSFKNPVTVSEYHLADAAGLLLQRFPYVFVQCGALDIDRLAAFHMASRGRRFCCDPYQMSLLEIVRQSSVARKYPAYSFERARVWMDGIVVSSDSAGTEPFCMAVRTGSDFRKIIEPYAKAAPEKTLFVYSMSEGYLKEHLADVQKLTRGLRYAVKVHTSGHASTEALRLAAETVRPQVLIPIHTKNAAGLDLELPNTRILHLEDGERREV